MTLAAQSTKDSKYIHDTAKLMQNYRDVLWNAEDGCERQQLIIEVVMGR
jgi:hypothetical protein